MKKKGKRLTLQKDTIVKLQGVWGGDLPGTSRVIKTGTPRAPGSARPARPPARSAGPELSRGRLPAGPYFKAYPELEARDSALDLHASTPEALDSALDLHASAPEA